MYYNDTKNVCSTTAGEPLHRLNIVAKEIEALLGVFKIQDIWVKQRKRYFGEKLM